MSTRRERQQHAASGHERRATANAPHRNHRFPGMRNRPFPFHHRPIARASVRIPASEQYGAERECGYSHWAHLYRDLGAGTEDDRGRRPQPPVRPLSVRSTPRRISAGRTVLSGRQARLNAAGVRWPSEPWGRSVGHIRARAMAPSANIRRRCGHAAERSPIAINRSGSQIIVGPSASVTALCERPSHCRSIAAPARSIERPSRCIHHHLDFQDYFVMLALDWEEYVDRLSIARAANGVFPVLTPKHRPT